MRAGRSWRLVVAVGGGGLDPELAAGVAAGELLEQIERLGQHVVARHRLELRNIERGRGWCAAPAVLGETVPLPAAAFDGVAGVEQHGAAVLHIGVDVLQRLARGPRRARHHRPVDQRIERELVLAGIDPDRIAGFERGALREEQRQPLQAGAADAVDLVVAGDDVGEARLQRRAQRGGVVLRLPRLRQHQRRGRRSRAQATAAAARRGRRRNSCAIPPARKNTTSASSASRPIAASITGPRRSCGSLTR